jgi:hypothetical protein
MCRQFCDWPLLAWLLLFALFSQPFFVYSSILSILSIRVASLGLQYSFQTARRPRMSRIVFGRRHNHHKMQSYRNNVVKIVESRVSLPVYHGGRNLHTICSWYLPWHLLPQPFPMEAMILLDKHFPIDAKMDPRLVQRLVMNCLC